MAERPIIFSGSMVRALLADRKSITRRILKPQPMPFYTLGQPCAVDAIQVDGEDCPRIALGRVLTEQKVRFAVGDRLWVREAWRTTDGLDNLSPADIRKRCLDAGYLGPWAPILYLADNTAMNWESEGRARGEAGRLRAAMHMPRWASRITLAVTAVKVERLQDITEEDAKAEGIPPYVPDSVIQQGPCWYRFGFEDLWNSLHGPGAWLGNPWIVAISFGRADAWDRDLTLAEVADG